MDWLEEELGGYDDDYLVIDCPGRSPCTFLLLLSHHFQGQIELYTHHPFLPTLVRNLQRLGLRTCAAYLIESQFMEDKYKFFRRVAGPLSHSLRCSLTRQSNCLPHHRITASPSDTGTALGCRASNLQWRALRDVSDGQPRDPLDQRDVEDGSCHQQRQRCRERSERHSYAEGHSEVSPLFPWDALQRRSMFPPCASYTRHRTFW